MSRCRSRPERWAAWLLPACLGLKARGTPFHLIQFEAGDGADLIADYLERPALVSEETGGALPGPEGYKDCPYPVLSRTGLYGALPDPSSDPLLLALQREPSGPKLHACPRSEMPSWAERNLPPRPEEGLLAFQYFPAEAGFREPMSRWLTGWGELGFWAELNAGELLVHRVIEGALESRVLGRLPADGGPFRVGKGWNFLQPLSPVRPPRVTIEEPPKARRP